jgi:Transposase
MEGKDLKVYCGIDWAEKHHDIALVDDDGQLVARRRITETLEGFAELVTMLAQAGDHAEDPIPVAIETPRGLLVAALRATGRRVYPINPMAVARYRQRHSASRKKSDHADAMMLANILRTDIHAHRPLPADTELARAVAVLARAHQDATWRRSRAGNELRFLLREFHPGFLAAFAGGNATNLASPDARAVLAIAPTPAAAATLTQARIAAALRRGGRQRGADQLAAKLHQALRQPQLRQDPMVEQAMGAQALRLLATLNIECDSVDQLGQATATAFATHPDYQIITSFTGLGDTTGARVLAEIGDDRARFADARSLEGLRRLRPRHQGLGPQPVGHPPANNKRPAGHRRLRLGLVAAAHSPGASTLYYQRREHADRHAAALRNVFNRLLGCLYHCLQTGQTYSEAIAFPTPNTQPEPAAA